MNVLVLVGTYFPTGVAGSSRMLNFCRLFKANRYKVHVIAAYTKSCDILKNKVYSYENFTYQIACLSNPKALYSFCSNPEYIEAVNDYINKNPIDFVFTTASCESYNKILSICQRHNIKLYVEQCEWMDVSSYKFGYLDIRYINTCYLRKIGYKKATGIISISRLLDNYYNSIGQKSIRIPTILDVKGTVCAEHKLGHTIRIIFAGSLGGSKEWMKPIIESLASDERYQQRIILDVYGPSYNEIKRNIGNKDTLLEKVKKNVIIHGHIPQEQVSTAFAKADFLIFIRPQRRSSNAGFPTKLAESMQVGTPVIANDTGDIGLYLTNEKNGYLLSGNRTEDVSECFNKIIELNAEKYQYMREFARKTAEESFDYRQYSSEMYKFITEMSE